MLPTYLNRPTPRRIQKEVVAWTSQNCLMAILSSLKSSALPFVIVEIFLCDSVGQYHYGTTDVTSTICFSKPKNHIGNIKFHNVYNGSSSCSLGILIGSKKWKS